MPRQVMKELERAFVGGVQVVRARVNGCSARSRRQEAQDTCKQGVFGPRAGRRWEPDGRGWKLRIPTASSAGLDLREPGLCARPCAVPL